MKVRYYGSAGLPTGYGVAANELCMSLLAAGCELELRVYGASRRSDYIFDADVANLVRYVKDDHELDPNPDVVIVHALPFHCWPTLEQSGFGDGSKKRPLCIAYTTWEGVSAVPVEVCEVLSAFDRVWVPSAQNARCFADSDVIPRDRIQVVPHSFSEESMAERFRRHGERKKDGRFRFYYFGGWNARKNVDGLLMAWAAAFKREAPVELWLYTQPINRTERIEDKLTVRRLAMGARVRDTIAPVRLVPNYLSERDVYALHRDNDCYVTATRGEAFNLPAFHAQLAGRHVIHTAHTGADEHLEHGTGAFNITASPQPACEEVTFTLEGDSIKVGAHQWAGLDARSRWLEPDIAALAEAMRFAAKEESDPVFSGWQFERRTVGALARKLMEGYRG